MTKSLFFYLIILFSSFPLFMSKTQNDPLQPLYDLGYKAIDIRTIHSRLSTDDIQVILQNHITKNQLIPYLNIQSFNFQSYNAYESLRTSQNLSRLEAVNRVNVPFLTSEFYRHISASINMSTSLILVNKNYVLQHDFIPTDLVYCEDVPHLIKSDTERYFLKQEVYSALRALLQGAKSKGLTLYLSNGYRSYEKQVRIYETYQKISSNPDSYSARPGHSEHQTGYALDLTSESANYLLTPLFEETKEGHYISENAYKYGFIIRYPKEKESITGYTYEPWHLRYVGKPIAKIITKKGLTLEEYLYKYTVIS